MQPASGGLSCLLHVTQHKHEEHARSRSGQHLQLRGTAAFARSRKLPHTQHTQMRAMLPIFDAWTFAHFTVCLLFIYLPFLSISPSSQTHDSSRLSFYSQYIPINWVYK